ncbi:MAG TPA: sensor histidine kinase [Clostridia bacterium]|nr:sensor histidine kinase [Clostridia bacterium]
MSGTTVPLAGAPAPLPIRQFRGFVTVFHVIFLAGLTFCILMRWRRPEVAWGLQDTALLALYLLQVGLYVRFFILLRTPPQDWKGWSVYFLTSYAIWLAEWRLEPSLEWTAWAYLGQMFGVLPPRVTLPASIAVFVSYSLLKLGWERLAAFSIWEWFGAASLVVSVTSLGMFLHRISTTSSDRARLIEELEGARKQLELARQRDAELAALRERERLARDLHDSLGHNLVTLTVQLEAAQRLMAPDPARATSILEEMKQLTRTSMEQLRRSLAGLRAPGLGDQSLTAALERLCAELRQRTSLKVECHIKGNADTFTPAVGEVLWRVAQEGVANVEKHAMARTVQISLQLNRGGLPAGQTQATSNLGQAVLRVTDDGEGLPLAPEMRPGHYGLRGLRERVEGLGGTFTTSANRPQGTIIEARVPIVI